MISRITKGLSSTIPSSVKLDSPTKIDSVYVELADQYKEMDAVSNVPKRNVLAQHLREVVDILEQKVCGELTWKNSVLTSSLFSKGDQIASLYDLLTFKDKPARDSLVPSRTRPVPSLQATMRGQRAS